MRCAPKGAGPAQLSAASCRDVSARPPERQLLPPRARVLRFASAPRPSARPLFAQSRSLRRAALAGRGGQEPRPVPVVRAPSVYAWSVRPLLCGRSSSPPFCPVRMPASGSPDRRHTAPTECALERVGGRNDRNAQESGRKRDYTSHKTLRRRLMSRTLEQSQGPPRPGRIIRSVATISPGSPSSSKGPPCLSNNGERSGRWRARPTNAWFVGRSPSPLPILAFAVAVLYFLLRRAESAYFVAVRRPSQRLAWCATQCDPGRQSEAHHEQHVVPSHAG